MDSSYNPSSMMMMPSSSFSAAEPTSPTVTAKATHLTLAQKVELASLAKKLLNQQDLVFRVWRCMDVNHPFRKLCIRITHSEGFEILTQIAILINCVILGMYDPLSPPKAPPRNNIVEHGEIAVQIYFTIEMLIKLVALGFYGKGPSGNYTGYFNDPWHYLDSGVVILSWLSFLPEFSFSSVLRALRVIRPIRWISAVPSLRAVVSSILQAIPALGNVVLLAFFTLLIFGIMGVQLWAGLLRGNCAYEDINQPGNWIFITPTIFCALSCEGQHVEVCSDSYGDSCVPQLIYDVFNSTSNSTTSMVLPTQCYMNDNPGNGFISFDDTAHAAMTVLTGITLEGWSDSMYATYRAWGLKWFVIIYWVIVVTFGAYFLLQLALAVIWDSYQNNHTTEEHRAEKVIFANASTLITYLRNRRKKFQIGEQSCASRTRVKFLRCLGYESSLIAPERIGVSRFLSSYINIQVLNLLGGENSTNNQGSNRNITFTSSRPNLSSPPTGTANGTPRRSSIITMDGQIIPTGVGATNSGGRRSSSVSRRPSVSRRASVTRRPSIGMANNGAGSSPTNRRSSITNRRSSITNRRGSLSSLDGSKDSAGKLPKNVNEASHEAIEALLLHLLPPKKIKVDYPPRWPAFSRITSSSNFSLFFVGVIVANTIVLALPYARMSDDYSLDLEIANDFFTSLFVLELILYLIADGPKRYFSKSLNILDFVIVLISIMDILVGSLVGAAAGFGLTALRTLRLARVLKLAKAWADLRLLLQTIYKSLIHVWAAVAVLIVVEFVFSLLFMRLFGGGFQKAYKNGEIDVLPRFSYDDLWSSFLSVFQTTTGENWNAQLIAGNRAFGGWYVVIMIILYVIGNFFFLNLFLAILLGAFEVQMEAEKERMYQAMLEEEEKKQLEALTRRRIEERSRKNLNVTNKDIEIPVETTKTLQRKATFIARVVSQNEDNDDDDDDPEELPKRSSTTNFTMEQLRKKLSSSPTFLASIKQSSSRKFTGSNNSNEVPPTGSNNSNEVPPTGSTELETEILPNTPFTKEKPFRTPSPLIPKMNTSSSTKDRTNIPTTANDEPIRIRDETPSMEHQPSVNTVPPLTFFTDSGHSTSDPPPLSASDSNRDIRSTDGTNKERSTSVSVSHATLPHPSILTPAPAVRIRMRNSLVGSLPMDFTVPASTVSSNSLPMDITVPVAHASPASLPVPILSPSSTVVSPPIESTATQTSTSSMIRNLNRNMLPVKALDKEEFETNDSSRYRSPPSVHATVDSSSSPPVSVPRRTSLLQAAEGKPVPNVSVANRRRSILKTGNSTSISSPESVSSPPYSHVSSPPPSMQIRVPSSNGEAPYNNTSRDYDHPPNTHSLPPPPRRRNSIENSLSPPRRRNSVIDHSLPPPRGRNSVVENSALYSHPPLTPQLSNLSADGSSTPGRKPRRKLALRYKSEAAQSGWSAAQLRKQVSKRINSTNSSPNTSTRNLQNGSPMANHRGSIAGIARRSSQSRRASTTHTEGGQGTVTKLEASSNRSLPSDTATPSPPPTDIGAGTALNGSQNSLTQDDSVAQLSVKNGIAQNLTTTLTSETGHDVTVKIFSSGDVVLESVALNQKYDPTVDGAETPFEMAAWRAYHKLKISTFLSPHQFTDEDIANNPALQNSRYYHTWDQYSLFTFSPDSRIRSFMAMILANPYFENFLLFIILLSSLNLALDEPYIAKCKSIPYGQPGSCYALYVYLDYCDLVIIGLFILEMIFKIIVFGAFFPLQIGYLRDPWNLLDFFVVIVTILSLSLEQATTQLRALRSLRAIRALRPLRVLSRFPSLKLVVNSMLTAIPKAATVIIINFLFMFTLAIIGIQNFAGASQFCNDPSIEYKEDCVGEWYLTGEYCKLLPHESMVIPCATNSTGVAFPRIWDSAPRNCDNILRCLLTVFETAAGEGWPDIMYGFMDTVGFDLPMERNANPPAGLFFIIIQLCCGFFLLELFTGVIIANYYSLKNQATGSGILSDTQRQWVEHMQLIMKLDTIKFMERPNLDGYPWIFRRIRALCFRISRSKYFELSVTLVIVLNAIVLAFHHTTESKAMVKFQNYANYIFVAIYVLEAWIKMIAYGVRQYFTVWWNRFDFALAATSTISLITDIGPLASMFRIFRVIRIIRLVRMSRGLLVLLRTLIVSLPALFNVGVVLSILLFIFAVIGMNLFSGIRRGMNNILNDDTNFDTFFTSVLTLFRSATGENWNGIMHALEIQTPYCLPEDRGGLKMNCGETVKPAFFFTVFIGLSTFMLIKLLSAVVLDSFSDMIAAELEDEDGYKLTPDKLEAYRDAWAVCDPSGTKLIYDWALVKLVTLLPHPLGVRNGPLVNSGIPLRKAAFALLSELDLPPTADGRYQFQAVLQELLRHASKGKAVTSLRLQLTGKHGNTTTSSSNGTDSLGFNLKDSIAAMRVQSVIRSKMARRRVFAIMQERRNRVAAGTLPDEKRHWNVVAMIRRTFAKKQDDEELVAQFRSNVKVIKAATVLEDDEEEGQPSDGEEYDDDNYYDDEGNNNNDGDNESPKFRSNVRTMKNSSSDTNEPSPPSTMVKKKSFFQFR